MRAGPGSANLWCWTLQIRQAHLPCAPLQEVPEPRPTKGRSGASPHQKEGQESRPINDVYCLLLGALGPMLCERVGFYLF